MKKPKGSPELPAVSPAPLQDSIHPSLFSSLGFKWAGAVLLEYFYQGLFGAAGGATDHPLPDPLPLQPPHLLWKHVPGDAQCRRHPPDR